MDEQDSNCGNCRFFKNQQIMGICRYNPQIQNKHETDWCGQHEPQLLELPVYDITTDGMTKVTALRKPGRPKKC